MEDLLDGRYELGAPLGSGGTGAVRRARDRVLGREVAVKLLHPGALDDETHRARLRAEARLAGALQHPGTARVFDYGEDAATTPPTPYVVMELVEGPSLAAVLRERRTLPVAEVLALLEQVGAALAAAHEAGIVHRDLKPGNIVLAPGGRAVLVDFGIARSAGAEPLTATGQVVGTVDYISPEQVSGGHAGPASDLYALGLVAHECLSGRKPFRRESQVATALAHLHDDAPALPEEVPAGLRHLVTRLTARDPGERPASARDVADAAARLRAGPDDRDPVTVLLTRPATGATAAASSGSTARRRRRLVAAVTAVVLLTGGLLAATVLGRDGATTAPAAEASDPRTSAPAGVRVPRGLVGQRYAAAAERLRAAGLRPERVNRTTAEQPPGTVLAVDPAPGEGRVPPGTVVRLRVASPPPSRPDPTPTVPSSSATGGGAARSGGGGADSGGGAPGRSEQAGPQGKARGAGGGTPGQAKGKASGKGGGKPAGKGGGKGKGRR